MDNKNNQENTKNQMIGCGMYAISEDLKTAWSSLFAGFQIDRVDKTWSPTLGNMNVEYSTEEELYASKNCLIAHTCGYPYLKKWQKSHAVTCVPKFDIDGCQGINYRSWFIKKKTDDKKKLEEFQNTRVAINSWTSNSGMNVLRFAISKLNTDKRFFSAVCLTGSHYQSALSVANGTAEIAAVDAVTFYFLCQSHPEIVTEIEIFDQSVLTPGLPFIQPRDSELAAKEITSALNLALNQYLISHKDRLKISSFIEVDESRYMEIQELENQSVKNGYPTLA